MKFVTNTVSKPVAGKEAKALSAALKQGRSMTSREAASTIERIAARRKACTK